MNTTFQDYQQIAGEAAFECRFLQRQLEIANARIAELEFTAAAKEEDADGDTDS